MMFVILIISLILTFFIYKILKNHKRRLSNGLKELPSASGGLPIVGHLFTIGKRPYEYFMNIGENIGPIYKIQIGWKDIIIMNNNDIINKCLKEQGDNFSGRWRNVFTDQVAHFCGILFTEKELWATQRSFTLKVLKDFGFGKSKTERIISKEIEKILSVIKFSGGKSLLSADLVSLATINVMSDFMFQKEFEENDLEVVGLIQNIRKFAQKSEINNIIVNIFPIFNKFPKIELFLYKALDKDNGAKIIEKIYDFIDKIISEHRSRFSPDNECEDLVDSFLLEQYKLKSKNIAEHSFIDWQLLRMISELFAAGFETTSTTLTWAFLILARYPNIQQKMYQEIHENIGNERYPTMSDKKSLNYCQAVMDEILRFSTLVPLALPHKVFNDTSVEGYFIPKNSIIFTNIYACHRDPKIWKKPFDFFPEHFLNEVGKYTPRMELIPFGVGKRICLGESLAKMEYFIFLTTIIQRFQLSLDNETSKKSNYELFNGSGGTIRGTIEHKIIFKEISAED